MSEWVQVEDDGKAVTVIKRYPLMVALGNDAEQCEWEEELEIKEVMRGNEGRVTAGLPTLYTPPPV